MSTRWSCLALFVVLLSAALANGCGSGDAPGPGGGDDGNDAGYGFGSGDGGQNALTISPQNATLLANGPGTTLQFQAFFEGQPQKALWTIDVADIGTIDASGLFTTSGLLAGTAHVSARVGNLSATASFFVHLTISDNPGSVDPMTQAQLIAGGNADPLFRWLYPYDRTVFPRGIDPPVLQPDGDVVDAALVHISFAGLDYQGFYGGYYYEPNYPNGVALTPELWRMVSQSAGANDKVQVQLTKMSAGQVTGPITETWSIAQGTLRGTVYYGSYNSQLAGNTGAVLSVRPGQDAQVVVAGCRVCHSVSADGSTLVAVNEVPNATATDRVWDLKNGAAPAYDAPDRTWAFGALSPDGSRLLRFGALPDTGQAAAGWAPNVRGLGQWGELPSALFDTKSGQALAAPGLDGQDLHMMMPTFSPDGKMVAFNHYDSGRGHTIAVMDFDGASNTFSNLRDIATIPTAYLGWPAFTPDDKFVVFAAGTNVEYDTISDDANALPNPKSDLWIAHVPTGTIAPADELNGVHGGAYYLPFGEQAEGHLDFEPTILPEAVGGYYWVVFTSRREFGGTLNDPDPYNLDAQPGARKKLWVAAIDVEDPKNPYAKAQDLTHPAFYLDGQELSAGNMRGFWALDPCQSNGSDCQSGDECCSGFCRQTTTEDGGTAFTCVPPQGCANEGEKCVTVADCCGASNGTQCIAGYCSSLMSR